MHAMRHSHSPRKPIAPSHTASGLAAMLWCPRSEVPSVPCSLSRLALGSRLLQRCSFMGAFLAVLWSGTAACGGDSLPDSAILRLCQTVVRDRGGFVALWWETDPETLECFRRFAPVLHHIVRRKPNSDGGNSSALTDALSALARETGTVPVECEGGWAFAPWWAFGQAGEAEVAKMWNETYASDLRLLELADYLTSSAGSGQVKWNPFRRAWSDLDRRASALTDAALASSAALFRATEGAAHGRTEVRLVELESNVELCVKAGRDALTCLLPLCWPQEPAVCFTESLAAWTPPFGHEWTALHPAFGTTHTLADARVHHDSPLAETRSYSLADAVACIRNATGVGLFVDRRLAANRVVLHLGTSEPTYLALAQALSYATMRAWRQVGDVALLVRAPLPRRVDWHRRYELWRDRQLVLLSQGLGLPAEQARELTDLMGQSTTLASLPSGWQSLMREEIGARGLPVGAAQSVDVAVRLRVRFVDASASGPAIGVVLGSHSSSRYRRMLEPMGYPFYHDGCQLAQ